MEKNSSNVVGIKEEFSGDALISNIQAALKEIVDEIECTFDEEVKAGIYTEYLYKYPCIYTQKEINRKLLKIIPAGRKIVKTIILKIVFADRELKCYVYDQRVLEAAKTRFGNLIKLKKEFNGYSIAIKKDFLQAA